MEPQKKNAVLAVYRIFLRYSDPEHPLTMAEVLTRLENEYDIFCTDETVMRHIRTLMDMGCDFHLERGKQAAHYLESRLLTRAEVKLIADALNASPVVDSVHSESIVERLKSTLSVGQVQGLSSNVQSVNVAKTQSDRLLHNMEQIDAAIAAGCQIVFHYLQWNAEKQLVPKQDAHTGKEKLYRISPWLLLWANDRYYLYGYIQDEVGVLQERHFRLDKLVDIRLAQEPRLGEDRFRQLDISAYTAQHLGMFSGKACPMEVEVPVSLVGVFIDQFGRNVIVRPAESSGRVCVLFHAPPSETLFGWLMGLPQVRILQPPAVRRQFAAQLRACLQRNEM